MEDSLFSGSVAQRIVLAVPEVCSATQIESELKVSKSRRGQIGGLFYPPYHYRYEIHI